ncbi:MAG: MBL fold metallo-hydrolase, partial [Propionibacteriaceae bacterium]|nr:MBL fold metallo-hydrolase [Propionibacteriaceae bacterium]
KFLLDTGTQKILVDGGMFQGDKELRDLNWAAFPLDPATIDAVLLTHAHMDHCGYLPRLVADGFSGPIWATDGTEKLAEIVLMDSAKIQEMDAKDAAKGGYSKHPAPQPLYTTPDVEATMKLFRFADFDIDIEVLPGVNARYYRAGHILGSASIRVATSDAEVVFSGDVGRHDHPVLKSREIPQGAPYVLVESTYGDREHPEWDESPHEELADAIRRTAKRGGSTLIPAFAVDRTEILLKTLAGMKADGRIPDLPIYVNSPMGVKALNVYQDPSQADELREDLRGSDFVDLQNVHEITSAEDSIKLNRPSKPCIIIASSGMATGGRVVHHLEHMLPDPRNTVIFTGYQARGTRGQSLVSGAKQLKMYGKYIPVRAEVFMDDGFSAHADASDILDWLKGLDPKPETVFCVHGEEGAPVLAQRIRDELDIVAVVPVRGEKVLLSGKSGQFVREEPVVISAPSASAKTAKSTKSGRGAKAPAKTAQARVPVKTVKSKLPQDVLDLIDAAADKGGVSRDDAIAEAIRALYGTSSS